MKRIHPNAIRAAALAASTLAVGCQSNSSGGLANPFLAPNRVPPPATRAIPPGQAQPYYPGDPLPVMQSSAPPSVQAGALAWGAPNGDAQPPSEPSAPTNAVAATEPRVAIPTDGGALRFDLPGLADEPVSAPAAPSMAAPTFAATTSGASVLPPMVVQPPPQGVVQASYSEPDFSDAPALVSPWQPPRIAQAAPLPPPPIVQQVVTQPQAPLPVAAAPNMMDVRLRAVASPPPEPMPGSSPRIRLPGEADSQMATSDGFRARGSMR